MEGPCRECHIETPQISKVPRGEETSPSTLQLIILRHHFPTSKPLQDSEENGGEQQLRCAADTDASRTKLADQLAGNQHEPRSININSPYVHNVATNLNFVTYLAGSASVPF